MLFAQSTNLLNHACTNTRREIIIFRVTFRGHHYCKVPKHLLYIFICRVVSHFFKMKNFFIFLFFFVANCNAETTVMASGIEAPEGSFWLTTELISLTFAPECLSTKYCVQPIFKITQSMATVPESHSMSWPITENLTKVRKMTLE